MTPLPKGQIIRSLLNGQGKKPDWKIRPAVVIRYEEEGDRYRVLVGTHSLRSDDPDRVAVTSGKPHGERVTGLSEKTQINCDWWEWVDRDDIKGIKGHLPPSELLAVCRRAAEIKKARESGKRP